MDLQQQVYCSGLGILVRLGVLIDLERIEVLQLVEAQKAVLHNCELYTWPSSSISSRRMTRSRVMVLPWNSMRDT